MNWYKQAKNLRRISSAGPGWYDSYRYAQIWNVQYDESSEELASQIAAMYELEYKYSMLRSKPFGGLPRRQEMILNQLQEKLGEVITGLQDKLLSPLARWLEFHALLSPETWARKRVQEFIEGGEMESAYRNAVYEYDKYVINFGELNSGRPYRPVNDDRTFQQMIQQARSEIALYPALAELLEQGLVGHKEMLMEDLHSEGVESFGRRYSKEFKDIDEAEAFIDGLTFNDVDMESLFYFEGIESFVDFAEQVGRPKGVLIELFQNLVFPGWFQYWSSMGIEETRENVENIYQKLSAINPEDVGNSIAVISMTLNAVHQTGPMLDYIEQDTGESSTEIKHVLDEMTAGTHVAEWNTQLREIGVQI